MLRIGVVGIGGMGSHHSAQWYAMPNVELVAVADIRPEVAAERAKQRGGCKSFGSLEEMLNGVELDAVDICVPTPWHKELTLKAAAAGKHVCCEKPMARTLSDCRAMIDACEEAGVRLFIAHVLRYFQEFRRGKEMIDQGVVGKPTIVRTSRGGRHPIAWNDWFANYEWSGGVILDTTIHDFDWLRWCFGDVERVYAKGLYKAGLDHIDYGLVTLRFKSGVISHTEATWARYGAFRTMFDIAGDAGLLTHDSRTTPSLNVDLKEAVKVKVGVQVPASSVTVDPYYLELEHFANCLKTGEPLSITPYDALKAVEIGVAALESVETGKPVTLA
ncbi:MAG: Gfo/Idh/MocA family oxidoreductase [Armatimonadota bacterium]|nr:Gfo/Idh/MocA family oxidoreductase [Armatimonadota bacterium]